MAYYNANKAERNKASREYAKRNPEKISAIGRERYNRNREEILRKGREWRKLNRDKINAHQRIWMRNRMANDPTFRMARNIRERVRYAVKNMKTIKHAKTKDLLGCSMEFLRGFIEAKFEIGMTWDNYGEWELDHIIPCAGFDLTNAEAQRECFHYSNLQPLWKNENTAKGDRMPDGRLGRTVRKESLT